MIVVVVVVVVDNTRNRPQVLSLQLLFSDVFEF
jgi:hypothetical protein